MPISIYRATNSSKINIGFMKSDPRARTSEQSINSIAYTPETNYFNPIIYTE